MKTLCIIPVYNEELNLKDTLESVRMHNFGVDKFLFVNSGSTDKSTQILNESEFEILNIKKNRGIGYVIIKGIDYCIENNFDVITIIHGGNKMDTNDFRPILNPILNENFDCVWGSRFINNTSINMPRFRKLSGRLLSSLVSKFYKIKVTDVTNGFRAYKIKLIIELLPNYNRRWLYGYAFESFLFGKMLNKKNIKKIEVPVTIKYNEGKVNTKIKPILNYPAIFFPYFLAKFLD